MFGFVFLYFENDKTQNTYLSPLLTMTCDLLYFKSFFVKIRLKSFVFRYLRHMYFDFCISEGYASDIFL
jgi:hypothetical protein